MKKSSQCSAESFGIDFVVPLLVVAKNVVTDRQTIDNDHNRHKYGTHVKLW